MRTYASPGICLPSRCLVMGLYVTVLSCSLSERIIEKMKILSREYPVSRQRFQPNTSEYKLRTLSTDQFVRCEGVTDLKQGRVNYSVSFMAFTRE
jgi:hypothetical protein